MRRKRGKSQGGAKIEGKIINMGSLGGLRPWATHAHYCSSKAAVHMLTKVDGEGVGSGDRGELRGSGDD